MIAYIRSFNLLRFIYVRLLKPDRLISDPLTEMGFENIDVLSYYGRVLYIYRIRIAKV
jgi:hypothetical protein